MDTISICLYIYLHSAIVLKLVSQLYIVDMHLYRKYNVRILHTFAGQCLGQTCFVSVIVIYYNSLALHPYLTLSDNAIVNNNNSKIHYSLPLNLRGVIPNSRAPRRASSAFSGSLLNSASSDFIFASRSYTIW